MRVELDIHGSESLSDIVCFDQFHRHDHGVLQDIVEDHAVENVNGAVIRTRSEEGVFVAEHNLSDRFVVVLERLIGFSAHI